MERVTVRMARSDRRTPWGFGVTEAPDRSVVIVNVVGGSLADRAGLRNGDILDKLEELGDLDIMAVDRLLVTSLDKIELVVHRAASGPARIWRPEIRETNDADRPYAVNLEHNSDSRPPQGFNASALPFETDSRVKHLQYNSPLGLYSDSAAAEQYVQQTTGYVEGDQRSARNVAQKEQQPSYLRSETLKQIKAEEGGRGASTLSSHPNPDGLPVCFVCQRPILGVMARAQGRDLHGDCLACATCGNSLRNVGHHFIDEKFYCDVHAAQKRGASLSRGSVDPNLVTRTPPTAAQPTRPSEPPRSFYQPEVLSSRPLSVSPVPTSGTTVITHYSTPKTQGIINPQNRGVPTAIFGADLKTTQTYGGSSTGMGGTVYGAGGGGAGSGTGIGVQGAGYGQGAGAGLGSGNYNNFSGQQSQTRTIPVQQAPPPIPSTQPPSINTQVSDSRVPVSLREAVSPKRAHRSPRPWPPPPAVPTNKYWQIEPAIQMKNDRPMNEPRTLEEMVRENDEKTKTGKPEKKKSAISKRNDARRKSQIAGGDVRLAISQSQQPETSVSTTIHASRATPEIHVTGPIIDPPKIVDGIHWTVIHSPESPPIHARREPESDRESPQKIIPAGTKTEPSQAVRKPIPVVANSRVPLKIHQPQQHQYEPGVRKLEPPPIEIVSPIIKLVSRPTYMETIPPEIEHPAPLDQHSPISVSSAVSDLPEVSRPTYIVNDVDITTYMAARDEAVRLKREEDARRAEEERRLVEEFGMQQTQLSPQLMASRISREPIEVLESEYRETAQNLPEPSQMHATQPTGLLKPIATTDSSTSPIPIIQLDRHHHHSVQNQQIQAPITTTQPPPLTQVTVQESEVREEKPKRKMEKQSSEENKVESIQVHKMVSVWEQTLAEQQAALQTPPVISHAPVSSKLRGGKNKKELIKPLRKVDFSKEQQQLLQEAREISQPQTHQPQLEIVRGQSIVVDRQQHQQQQHQQQEREERRERQERHYRPDIVPPAPPIRRDSPAQVLQQIQIARPQYLGQRDYPPRISQQQIHQQQQHNYTREEWAEGADIVDESDILTVASIDEDTRQMRASYDGDNESLPDNDRLIDALEEEREQLLRRRDDEETQSERDLRIVAALNARLQDIREMEEADRMKAIECIERHQRSLELQQDQLSHLLDSAIEYLKHLDERMAEKKAKKQLENKEEERLRDEEEFEKLERLQQQIADIQNMSLQNIQNKPPTPPIRKNQFVKTDSLNEALEELENIKIAPAARFIAQKINQKLEDEAEGNQGYTRTVTERTEKTVTNGTGSGTGLGANYDNSGQTTNFTSNIRTNASGSLHSGATGGRIPYCEACKQQIRGAFVLATGLAWCPEHFVCANASCGRRLLECGFVEESGRKYCEGCFEAHIAPRCAKCTKPIVSDCLNALQKKWHPTCFTCAHCQKPFGNSAFYLEQGLPYCERDWNTLFTTKCISCSYPIEAGDRWVEALGQAFHSNCFNCSRCHANLEGESFYARNGQPFCRLHA